MAKVRCERIGCDALFSEDDNPDGSYTYHDAPRFHDGMKEWSCCKKRSHDFSLYLQIPGYISFPICQTMNCFLWLCIEYWGLTFSSIDELDPGTSLAHDSEHIDSLFWSVKILTAHGDPGNSCKTGKHTIEKPVVAKVAAAPKQPVSAPIPTANSSSKDSCPRCRQGFFCSDHGSHTKELNPKSAVSANNESSPDIQEPKPPQAKKIVDINQPQICRNKGCGQSFKEKDIQHAVTILAPLSSMT